MFPPRLWALLHLELRIPRMATPCPAWVPPHPDPDRTPARAGLCVSGPPNPPVHSLLTVPGPPEPTVAPGLLPLWGPSLSAQALLGCMAGPHWAWPQKPPPTPPCVNERDFQMMFLSH